MRVEREVKQPILAVPPTAQVSTKPPADQEPWPRLPSSCSLSLQVMGGMAEQANNITPTSWSAASRGPCTTFLHANKCLESNSLQPKQGGWNPFNLLGKARHKTYAQEFGLLVESPTIKSLEWKCRAWILSLTVRQGFEQALWLPSSLTSSGEDQLCPRSPEWRLPMCHSSKLEDVLLPSTLKRRRV